MILSAVQFYYHGYQGFICHPNEYNLLSLHKKKNIVYWTEAPWICTWKRSCQSSYILCVHLSLYIVLIYWPLLRHARGYVNSLGWRESDLDIIDVIGLSCRLPSLALCLPGHSVPPWAVHHHIQTVTHASWGLGVRTEVPVGVEFVESLVGDKRNR